MDTVQILGLIVFAISAVCVTILLCKKIDSKRTQEIEQRRIDKEQTERIATDGAWALYEHEHQLRVDAETRENIAKHQLKRERDKSARLEQLLAVAEGKAAS